MHANNLNLVCLLRFNSIERLWGYIKVRLCVTNRLIIITAQVQKEDHQVGPKVSFDLPKYNVMMRVHRRNYTAQECKALVEQVIREQIPNSLVVKTLGFNREYIDKYLPQNH
jgi:hypothetical protein